MSQCGADLPGDLVTDGRVFNGDWQVASVVETTKVGRHDLVTWSVRLRQRRTADLHDTTNNNAITHSRLRPSTPPHSDMNST